MELVKLIEQWHEDRNLIEGSTDKDQVLKLVQELGELSDSVCKEKDMRDDLGDMLVVMHNLIPTVVLAVVVLAVVDNPDQVVLMVD